MYMLHIQHNREDKDLYNILLSLFLFPSLMIRLIQKNRFYHDVLQEFVMSHLYISGKGTTLLRPISFISIFFITHLF